MIKKPAKLTRGQVWTARRLRKARTVELVSKTDRSGPGFVYYRVTDSSHLRRCQLRTFRRWLYDNDAKRTQRGRVPPLSLDGRATV